MNQEMKNQNSEMTYEERMARVRMMIEFSDILPAEAYTMQDLLNVIEYVQTRKDRY